MVSKRKVQATYPKSVGNVHHGWIVCQHCGHTVYVGKGTRSIKRRIPCPYCHKRIWVYDGRVAKKYEKTALDGLKGDVDVSDREE